MELFSVNTSQALSRFRLRNKVFQAVYKARIDYGPSHIIIKKKVEPGQGSSISLEGLGKAPCMHPKPLDNKLKVMDNGSGISLYMKGWFLFVPEKKKKGDESMVNHFPLVFYFFKLNSLESIKVR